MRIGIFAALTLLSLSASPAQVPPIIPEFLVLDLAGNGLCFSPAASGVTIKLSPRQAPRRIGWTCRDADEAFVALDLTKNGRIDGGWELVGGTPGPLNGFDYLGAADGVAFTEPNRQHHVDGRIDSSDEIFLQLILWQDRNHNGISEELELQSAKYAGASTIPTAAQVLPRSAISDNVITRRGTVTFEIGGKRREHEMVSVRLAGAAK
jgi:hypothetical protein